MIPTKIIIIHNSHQARDEISKWLTAFKTNLELAISQLSSKGVTIELIDLNNYPENTLPKTDKTIIVSNGEDLENFVKDALTGKPDNTFLVVHSNPEIKFIPNEFSTSPLYTFSDIDSDTGLLRTYSSDSENATSGLYWTKILSLAFDLTDDNESQNNKTDRQKTIYVAQTTPDQYFVRDAVCSELAQRGFRVLPKHLLNGTSDEISHQVTEMLANSCLSVHIIGPAYGQPLNGHDVSLTELQYRLAAKTWRFAAKNPNAEPFNYIVWLPPFMRASDNRQQLFIESLRVEEKDESSEVLQVPVEELKASLRSKIQYFHTKRNQAVEVEKRSVYVIYDQKDASNALPLITYLESKKIQIFDILKSNTSKNIVSEHFEYLSNANVVIICDFNNSKHWVHSKFKDIAKAPGYGRTSPFLAKAVYTNNIQRYSSQNASESITIIDANFKIEEALAPIMQKLTL